jgi:hypothetical protein
MPLKAPPVLPDTTPRSRNDGSTDPDWPAYTTLEYSC